MIDLLSMFSGGGGQPAQPTQQAQPGVPSMQGGPLQMLMQYLMWKKQMDMLRRQNRGQQQGAPVQPAPNSNLIA